ncbi:hypothetical protein G3A43_06560 [Paraburkholderia aspalathi]|nr:hypothetical protein [Paraburkholderia aspalathi]MBK3779911.1 hypothetical protein [Paraburkholderia aspalathi]
MYGNDLSLGRNHYTADTAKLVTFDDCARSEIHWSDGAWVYELFDTRAEAIENLHRLGFDVSKAVSNTSGPDKGHDMNLELKQAIADLKQAQRDLASGKLKPVPYADIRGPALCKAVVALAAEQGVALEPIHCIDTRGELPIVVKDNGAYGEQFAATLTAHCRPRTGAIPERAAQADGRWCYITHFDAERMVLAQSE